MVGRADQRTAVNDGGEAARIYHHLTSHAPPNRFRVDDERLVAGYRPMDPTRRPPQFKRYGEPSLPIEDERLSRLLFYTAGVMRYADLPSGERVYFRAAGSAGNLSPLEVYVVDTGRVCHYEPIDHALTEVAAGVDPSARALIVTGVPWRTGWKYTERGYRHLYWDCGTMLANLIALEPDARLRLGFVDDEVAALVGADGVHEFVLAVVELTDSALPPTPTGHVARPGELAADSIEFPLITATQRAGVLDSEDEVAAWQGADPHPTPRREQWERIEEVIRRRGSTRQFAARSDVARRELLEFSFVMATEPIAGDFVPAGGTLLEHHVALHAIDGYEPGAYLWSGAGFTLTKPGDLRVMARRLTLDQELGGQGAYTTFHCADLDGVLSRLGTRGYRCAQLEAGIVEGRLHLGAFGLGYGASGLTFFDEAVREFFATRAYPMLVTAVGTPAYRSKEGGTPGRPVAIGR